MLMYELKCTNNFEVPASRIDSNFVRLYVKKKNSLFLKKIDTQPIVKFGFTR